MGAGDVRIILFRPRLHLTATTRGSNSTCRSKSDTTDLAGNGTARNLCMWSHDNQSAPFDLLELAQAKVRTHGRFVPAARTVEHPFLRLRCLPVVYCQNFFVPRRVNREDGILRASRVDHGCILRAEGHDESFCLKERRAASRIHAAFYAYSWAISQEVLGS